MYQLKTNEDFFYAVASEREVSFLRPDYIGGGPILQFNEYFVKIGNEYFSRKDTKFFIMS